MAPLLGGCPTSGTNNNDGGITLSAPSLEDIRLALGANNPLGMVPGLGLGAIELPPCTGEDGSALGDVAVSYSLDNLPAWLSFDPLTRTLSLSGGPEVSVDALIAALVTYACNITQGVPTPLSASQSFTLNDLDGGGVLDAFEYQFSWVPLLRADARFMGLPYSFVGADNHWVEVPTGITVTAVGMDPTDPVDDRADFDGDTLPNLNEIEKGTNLFVAASDGQFIADVDYGVGTWPYFTTTGDFDGDGNLDLATTNWSTNNISILLGVGDGTFASAVSYSVGRWPFGITTGDFDGDGNFDLAVVNWRDDDISILLGNGDGTFATPVDYPVGNAPYGISTGDFDGDGVLDLACTAAWGTNNVYILVGNGDGTFASAVAYGVGSDPIGMTLGDFDGDGNLDVAAANNGGSTVSILLGIGDGTFAAAVDYSVGSGPSSMTIGDFNKDGILDLAVANDPDGEVSILLGIGDGSFPNETTYPVGDRPVGMTIGDFDGDGHLDLATVNWNSDDISLLFGVGDGTFTFIVDYQVGDFPASMTTGDFDNDGSLDLGVTSVNDNIVSVLLNNGDCDDCLFPFCGDGMVDVEEACDDGNLEDGDGCSVLCVIEEENSPPIPSAPKPVASFTGSGCQLGAGQAGGFAWIGLGFIVTMAALFRKSLRRKGTPCRQAI